MHPIVKELNSEIQRSIDYFTGQQTSAEVNIEKIILSGGSANLKGLPELINADLRIPVEVFHPLEHAEVVLNNTAVWRIPAGIMKLDVILFKISSEFFGFMINSVINVDKCRKPPFRIFCVQNCNQLLHDLNE